MITSQMKRLVEKNALAVATVRGRKPHVIAVGFAKVVAPNKTCITDNCMRESPANIRKNPNIALAVWSRNWEKKCVGFEFRGTAKYITTGKWREFVKKMPENKGCAAKAAVLVTVKNIKRLA